jgi:uncharacterized membrane protein YraQ (UPF0718 family)
MRSDTSPQTIMILVIAGLALLVTALALYRGVALQGIKESGKLLVQVGPVLLPAFVLAGMASVLVPSQTVMHWLGHEAGLRGLLVGTVAGALTPGGPFIAFPFLAVLLKGGASIGSVSAYLTAWALLGVHRVAAFEIPILGWRFVMIRYLASLGVPVLVGALAQYLSTRLP